MNHSFKIRDLSIGIITTLALGLSHLQPAVAGTPDPRVKSALDRVGLKYELTKDGDYKVLLRFDDNRTQVVIINSNTEKINDTNIEIREVYSLSYRANGYLDATVANKMLKDSQDRKIGAWESIAVENSTLAVFNAKIPTSINAEDLNRIVRLVGIRSDVMEKELTNEDKF
jgi:hypothetical protein